MPKGTSWRASWKGTLRFGLVGFEVEAVNSRAADQGDIHFHQLHAPCHNRIRYEKVCPKHGPVEKSEIVSAYEYEKGKYVEIASDELDALRTEQEKALTIDHFLAPADLDPLYFDGRMYFLIPKEKASTEAYRTLTAALAKEKRWGVGHIVMSGKDQIVAVRPERDVLIMMMLNYVDEVRDVEDFKPEAAKIPPRQLQLAVDLISSWGEEKFDFEAYEDRYRSRLRELIDEKIAGKQGIAVEEDNHATPAIINLMDALRRSVKKSKGGAKKTGDLSRGTPLTRGRKTAKPAVAKRPAPTQRRKKA